MYRAVKATNRADLIEIFDQESKPYTESHSRLAVAAYLNDKEAYFKSVMEEVKGYVCKKQNDKKKIEQWSAVPFLRANSSLAWSLYYLNVFGITYPSIEIEVEKIWQTIRANPNFVKYAPVCTMNLVYHLRNLGFGDRTDQVCKMFNKIFTTSNLNDLVNFTNYIYGLTHIIIGESNFYLQPIDQKRLAWVREIFQQHLDDIYDRLTLDINAEVALSLLMLSDHTNPYIQRVKQRLEAQYVPEDGYIHYVPEKGYIHQEGNSFFEFAEHTNAVAVLLYNFDSLKLND